MNRKLYGMVLFIVFSGINSGILTAQSHKAVLMMTENSRPALRTGDTVIIQCRPIFTGNADRSSAQANRLATAEENNILLLCLAVGNSEESIKPYRTNVEIVAGVLDINTGRRNTGSPYIWDRLIGLGYVSHERPYIITIATKFFCDLASQRLMANEIGNEPLIVQMTVEVVLYEPDPVVPILIFRDITVGNN